MNKLTTMLVILALAAVCQADTYFVNPDGSGDFPTIQAAMDAAMQGDIIELGDGTFTGSGNRDLIPYATDLHLQSQSGDASLCRIDCGGSEVDPHFGIRVDAMVGSFELRDVAIQNAWSPDPGAGFSAEDCYLNIDHCIFFNNYSEGSGGGIYLSGFASNATLDECLIAGNESFVNGGGVAVADGAAIFIDRCIFSGNQGTQGGGIATIDASQATLVNCTLVHNSTDAILASSAWATLSNTIIASNTGLAVRCLGDYASASLSCCDLWNNSEGDWADCIWEYESVDGNISEDPVFCGVEDGPFNISVISPCAPFSEPNSQCDLIGAGDVACGPPVIHVNAEGTGDYPTIQAAIDAAWPEAVVELADGTYTGEGNRDIEFRGKALTLRSASGNADACVIDCQGSELDQHRGLIFQEDEGPATRVESIRIRNGYVSDFGGGVLCRFGSSPTLDHCIITECSTLDLFDNGKGGGLFADDMSIPTVSWCTFIANTADHGGAVALQSPEGGSFSYCAFSNNEAHPGSFEPGGGALFAENASPTILVCTFNGNSGERGGALSFLSGSPTLTQCTFDGNESGDGGAIRFLECYDPTVSDCAFTGNTANYGGALLFELSGGVVEYCRFTSNGSEWAEGPAIQCHFSYPQISFCTFNENVGYESGALNFYNSLAYVSFCTISGNVGQLAGAVVVLGDEAPSFENCIITLNEGSEPVHCINESVPLLACCDIYGNEGGDWVGCIADQATQDGNFSEDPLFCGAANPDEPYTLHVSSPCAEGNNPECQMQIGAWPVGCETIDLVVYPDGSGDYPTIQAALDAALPGAVISLGDGIYTGEGNRDLDFHGKALTLRSMSRGAEDCIIDAEGSHESEHRVMVFDDGEGPDTVVEGITLSNGYLNDGNGGGVLCLGSSPSIVSCEFVDNLTYSRGGGLFSDNSSSPSLTQCRFFSNQAVTGGGGAVASVAATFEDCYFSENESEGGSSLRIGGEGIYVTDCVFEDATTGFSGAIMAWGDVNIVGCRFFGDSGGTSTILVQDGSPLILDCSFEENALGWASCIRAFECTPEISGCTFAGNSGDAGVGSVIAAVSNSFVSITNSIFAFNVRIAVSECGEGSFVSLSCCDIYGNDAGDWTGCLADQEGLYGNFSLNPLFCGDANPEEPYTLRENSPCAEGNNPECQMQVGAWPVGCEPSTPVGDGTWVTNLYLSRPSPNPAKSGARIAFALPSSSGSGDFRLRVYDLSGRLVRTLAQGVVEQGSVRELFWDGRDESGRPASSGVYFLLLEGSGESRTEKLVLVR